MIQASFAWSCLTFVSPARAQNSSGSQNTQGNRGNTAQSNAGAPQGSQGGQGGQNAQPGGASSGRPAAGQTGNQAQQQQQQGANGVRQPIIQSAPPSPQQSTGTEPGAPAGGNVGEPSGATRPGNIGGSPLGIRTGQIINGAARVSAAVGALDLAGAIQLAIDNNLSTLSANEAIAQARGIARQLRANLLPNFFASAFQQNRTLNLRAQGITFGGDNTNGQPPPFTIPTFVGPFNTFDARVSFAQTIFNLASIRDYRSGRAGVRAAELQVPLAREQVAAAVAIAYLTVLRAERETESTRADLDLAASLLKLALDQRTAGIATGIDVVRAETRVAQQQLALSQSEANIEQARLDLQRLIGVPQGSALALTDQLRFTNDIAPNADAVVREALDNRYEIKIAEATLDQRRLERKARAADQYPELSAFGDYGESGNTPSQNDRPTRAYGVRLSINVFDGGLTRGRREVAASQERLADLQLGNTRGQIEEDARQALVALRTATQQVRTTDEQFRLSEREVQLARDRFRAGLGDNIEVINAQTALTLARANQTAALAQYNAARVNLAAALGRAVSFRF